MSFKNVSIIGAGLSGLSLALFLSKHNVKTTIYELRPENTTSEGAVMLSPNALRTLDALGLYSRIKDQGYHFRDLSFNNSEHKTLDKYEMGNADRFGYDALRVYRQVLLDGLKAMCAESEGIEIMYGKKFSHVISEDSDSITFAFHDGGERTADLLIGADGIHSTVRQHLAPAISPVFSNFLAITFPIQTSKIAVPSSNYPFPVTITSPAGAFVLAPQNPSGTEMLAGTQYKTHERGREGWDALWNDKAGLHAMLRENYDSWNPMVKSVIDGCPVEKLTIWPFYTVPRIPHWSSEAGRVVILGDAAHAIPPAAGQGVNQAFEDAHALSMLIESEIDWKEGVRWWQTYRQERVERVQGLTDEMNRRRMPGWKGEGAERMDSSWLFNVDVEGDVRGRINAQKE